MSSWLETWRQLELETAGKLLAQQHQCSGGVPELFSILVPTKPSSYCHIRPFPEWAL